jgi:hypothetical protein
MNHIETRTNDRKNLKKSVFVFLTCLVVGPAAGAVYLNGLGFLYLTYATLMGIELNQLPGFNQNYDSNTGTAWLALFSIFVLSIPYSYILGGVPAAVGGFLLGSYCYFFGRPSFWVPIAIAAIFCPVLFYLPIKNWNLDADVLAKMAILVLGLLFAALASWFFVVRMHFAVEK